jgi:hypothetical protein
MSRSRRAFATAFGALVEESDDHEAVPLEEPSFWGLVLRCKVGGLRSRRDHGVQKALTVNMMNFKKVTMMVEGSVKVALESRQDSSVPKWQARHS